jgi:tetratricopeptide (TPR) repeat protein
VALALSTGWLYWLGGVLATDMLVGIATFEIFHALQYDAIVWAYNRGRARKPDALVRPLGAMFKQDRWASLGLYLALIAAFSSIRLMGEVASDSSTQRILMALLTTSTFMHFYFDGFIWKVSERKMQDGLAIDDRAAAGRAAPLAVAPRWRLSHASLVAVGAMLAAGLIVCESTRQSGTAGKESDSLARLTALTPELPELKWRIGDAALAAGDVSTALDATASAARLRPYSQQAHARFGAALMAADRMPEAAVALREAARLGPRRWNNFCNLGIALGQIGEWDEATAAFERADRMQPGSATIQAAWGRMCERRQDNQAAIEHFQTALAIDPADGEVRASLVLLLSQSGRHRDAIQIARDGLDLDNRSAALHLNLGKALLAAGRLDKAIVSLGRARDLAVESDSAPSPANASPAKPPSAITSALTAPTAMPGGRYGEPAAVAHPAGNRDVTAAACYEMAVSQLQLGQLAEAERNLDRVLTIKPESYLAHFQVGNLRHAQGDMAGALQCYRRSVDLEPKFAAGYCNIATVLLSGGDAEHARKAYEQALSLAPDDGDTHYKLALLLLGQRQVAAARSHLLRARELGIALPPELADQLRLTRPQSAPQRFDEQRSNARRLDEVRLEEHQVDEPQSVERRLDQSSE